jgi:hypothetical protein
VIDAIGGDGLSEALGTLAMDGSLTTLGYAAGRKSTIDVTDLIWKRASVKSFLLFGQPPEMWIAANGLLSVCLQHEVNQLDGIFWIYRLSQPQAIAAELAHGMGLAYLCIGYIKSIAVWNRAGREPLRLSAPLASSVRSQRKSRRCAPSWPRRDVGDATQAKGENGSGAV